MTNELPALEGVGTNLAIVAGDGPEAPESGAETARLEALTAKIARVANVRVSVEAGDAPDRDLTLERIDAELAILRGRVAAFAPRVPRPQRHT